MAQAKKEKEKDTEKEQPTLLRQPAEMKYREELDYLISIDKGDKPFSWVSVHRENSSELGN
jgi:hypothetical protein